MSEGFHDRVRDAYRELREGLYGYALALTGEPSAAEDAVQAAFFGLLRVGRMPREVRPYLFRAVRNAALDLIHLRNLAPGGVPGDACSDGDALLRGRLLRQGMASLGEGERHTLLLRVLGGLTIAETASVLSAPQGTVASWHRRGLEKLRRTMEGS